MKITSGPNVQGWLLIAFVIWLSFNNESIMPIVYFLAGCAVLIPACILCHRYNERADAQMAKDFPYDPWIQEKYGKKKKNTERKKNEPD